MGGIGLVSIRNSGGDPSLVEDFENNSTTNNTPILGFNFNTGYKKWQLQSGLCFHQISEEVNYQLNETIQNDSIFIASYDTIVVYGPDSTGSFTVPIDTNYYAIYDTTSITDSSTTDGMVYNQYTWLNIPLRLGYEFKWKSWSFIPRAGVNFTIGIAKNRGTYPTASTALIVSPAVRFGWAFSGSLEIRKYFNRLHVFIAPSYWNRLQPFIEISVGQRRYSLWGIQGGIGIQF